MCSATQRRPCDRHVPCLTLDTSLSRASGMKSGANSGVAVKVASSAATNVSRVMLNLGNGPLQSVQGHHFCICHAGWLSNCPFHTVSFSTR